MTGATLRVRRATTLDKASVVRMGVRFCAESAYRGLFVPNVGQLLTLVEFLLDHGAIFVTQVDGGDDVVGMIGLHVLTHPISGELTGSEVAWWLDPEHRGGSAGLRLLAAAEAWAREQGAVCFQMIAPAHSPVAQLYRRRNYVEVETVYQRSLVA